MIRPSKDKVFMDVCDAVAQRGTCDRKQVGAIIVIDDRIVSTGYNSSIPGASHCCDPETFWECPRCGEKIEVPERTWDSEIGGMPLCDDRLCSGLLIKKHGGHDMEEGHCVRTVHGEINAIAQCAYLGVRLKDAGAKLYVNTLPCWACFKTIISAGVHETIYRDEYRGDEAGRVFEAAKELDYITLRRFEG
jgi:dCMP deaminase